jgi:ribulose-5-phosphate 4-epimerase/fuculose-1-phosphate aldolase
MRLPDVPVQWVSQAQAICQMGQRLDRLGYVHGTTGNISVKVPFDAQHGFMITPTDACLGLLDPARLAVVDASGEQRFGDRASKTLTLHRKIYETDITARAVIHTHSHHLVLLTLLGVWRDDEILPPITPYQVMKVGRVPLIPYALPGDPSVATAVAHAIATASEQGERLRAVMCERLGPQVWHEDLGKAGAVLEELEQTARLWLAAQYRPDQSPVSPLSSAQLAALRERFPNQ